MNVKTLPWIKLAVVLALLPSYSGASNTLDSATTLTAPIGYYLPAAEGKDSSENSRYTCETPPAPYTGPLQFSSKYEGSDASRDQLNKDAEQRYKEVTADISQLEKNSVKMAESYLLGKPGIASRHCLIAWLESWAKAGALLSTDSNHTGMSVRKWALGSIASAYFLVKAPEGAPAIAATKRQIIEGWFAKVAEQVVVDWSDRPESKRNNHDYWAAWSVMITSIVLNRQDLFDWANTGLRQGLAQVDNDGFLPNELKRSTRALSYHNYSIQPLVMLAVFAETNQVELTEAERLALVRLATITIEGLSSPIFFEQKTGAKQIQDGLATNYSLAWLEPYAQYFEESALFLPYLNTLRPMKTTRLGGDLTRIFNIKQSSLAAPPEITIEK